MKTKKKKYLPLYEKWMETGMLPGENGLCGEFGYYNKDRGGWVTYPEYLFFEMLKPDECYVIHNPYWAKDGEDDGCYFSTLRQTIVLFRAALNNEL